MTHQQKSAWQWGVLVCFLALAVGGLLWIAGRAPALGANAYLSDQPNGEDHVKGSRDARVVLVEYSDFQCPACGRYDPIVKAAHEKFGDDLLVVYRHFPLMSIHPNGLIASRAAEAASLQGKSWEMHDLLFEFQPDWSVLPSPRDSFIRYATQLGLDTTQFTEDLSSSVVENVIRRQIKSGNALRVNSTPTFYLNGVLVENPNGEELLVTIEAAVRAAKASASAEIVEPTQ